MVQKTNTNPFVNQKCMPGLYPLDDIAYSCPESEDKVYNTLSDALPIGWYAWHSLKLRTMENEFAECDFVITDPNQGILILEVKGGSIRKQEGLWYQNNKPPKSGFPPLSWTYRKVLHNIRLGGLLGETRKIVGDMSGNLKKEVKRRSW